MSAQPVTSILFVCLGNICRSPLAEGVFRAVAEERALSHLFLLDSAGTGGWHAGSAPDPRSVAIAAKHGIDITRQSARRVAPEDFEAFDLMLGMDHSNLEELRRMAPAGALSHIHLFLDYAGVGLHDVPDPYFGGPDGFADVYRMIREASESLLDRVAGRWSAPTSGQASSTT
jgi:protein-tyrosine phosphatase